MNKIPFKNTFDNLYSVNHQKMTNVIDKLMTDLKTDLIEINVNKSIKNNVMVHTEKYKELKQFNNFCSKGELYNIVLRMIGVCEEVRAQCYGQQQQQTLKRLKQNLLKMYLNQLKTSIDLFELFMLPFKKTGIITNNKKRKVSFAKSEDIQTQNDSLMDHHETILEEFQKQKCEQTRGRAKTTFSTTSKFSTKTNKQMKIMRLLC